MHSHAYEWKSVSGTKVQRDRSLTLERVHMTFTGNALSGETFGTSVYKKTLVILKALSTMYLHQKKKYNVLMCSGCIVNYFLLRLDKVKDRFGGMGRYKDGLR